MNDTLAIHPHRLTVPPGTANDCERPWWAVRRPLRFVLALLTILLLALSVNRTHLDRWMISELPIDDTIVVRAVGY